MIRVYELAKALGLPNKEVVERLRAAGLEVKSHSSTVDETRGRAALGGSKGKAAAKPGQAVDRTTKAAPPKPSPPRAKGRESKGEPAKAQTARRPTVSTRAEAPKAEKAPRARGARAAKPAPAPAAPLAEGPARAKPSETVATAPAAPPATAPPPAAPSPPRVPAGIPAGPAAPPQAEGPPVAPAAPAEPSAKVERPVRRPARPRGEPPRPAVEPPRHVVAVASPQAPTGAEPPHPVIVSPPPAEAPVQPPPPPPPPVAAPAPAAGPSAPEAPPARVLRIAETIAVKELAEKLGATASEVIKRLMKAGIMANINQLVNVKVAKQVAGTFGVEVEAAALEEVEEAVKEVEDPALLRPRSPVVTVMGHVDHGKTSLLDAIRHTDVIATEAGGITQHIGAYEVELAADPAREFEGGRVVFLDTPGHEAFTAMRARGAQVTDIVVLVVAADDGVMPQTIEAVNHAKAANVPILVAVNKMDKPNADPNRVMQQLADLGLVPEEWGGETIYVKVSAKKRTGIEDLLENLLLLAAVKEFKVNPSRPARGTVIEAALDKGRGPVATVLVQQGTLRVSEEVVAGMHHGRVRALINDKGKKAAEAGPSTPVEILGLSGVPLAGDPFIVVSDERKARQIALARQQKAREHALAPTQRVSLEDLGRRIKEGEVKELRVIIKGDVQGSIEAVRESLERLSTEAVRIKAIHVSVGAITESDVMLASASNAIIVGFNVRPEPKAQRLAEQERVDVRLHTVIYEAISEIRTALEGLLEPQYVERRLGRVEVRQTFSIPKVGTIAGCYVVEGKVARDVSVRLVRDGVVVHQGRVASLRRFKEDVREVAQGYECGVGLLNYNDVKIGDVLELFELEAVAPKL